MSAWKGRLTLQSIKLPSDLAFAASQQSVELDKVEVLEGANNAPLLLAAVQVCPSVRAVHAGMMSQSEVESLVNLVGPQLEELRVQVSSDVGLASTFSGCHNLKALVVHVARRPSSLSDADVVTLVACLPNVQTLAWKGLDQNNSSLSDVAMIAAWGGWSAGRNSIQEVFRGHPYIRSRGQRETEVWDVDSATVETLLSLQPIKGLHWLAKTLCNASSWIASCVWLACRIHINLGRDAELCPRITRVCYQFMRRTASRTRLSYVVKMDDNSEEQVRELLAQGWVGEAEKMLDQAMRERRESTPPAGTRWNSLSVSFPLPRLARGWNQSLRCFRAHATRVQLHFQPAVSAKAHAAGVEKRV